MHRVSRWAAAGLIAGGAIAALVGPAVVSEPAAVVATCPNEGVLVGKQQVGAYTTNCDLVVTPPPAIGAAPSAGAIIACRGLPGCLADFVNNPGWVKVPQVDTRPRQSP
ncbi:hypothetical protein C1S82_15165 [Mycolicibacterium cosmeticum]|uniref:Secreted protein n=1 Tax=Mycolicibacterium cosmeticum TaxID=258533 RepID=W9B0Z8_MYCCO|nr:hypothetical protein [Mycolicibacterium cosmeticum]TLH73311.1 hypothetical protein C1S82_15165 [Mycolicibacterium cosmeticum]CDO08822.1 hypothetical protein BN977_03642 [Mycolicibacterium cosmeticum]